MKFLQIISEAPAHITMDPVQYKRWMDDQTLVWKMVLAKEHLDSIPESDPKYFNRFMDFAHQFGEKFSELYEKYFKGDLKQLPSVSKMAAQM